jgi:hypothetical protein
MGCGAGWFSQQLRDVLPAGSWASISAGMRQAGALCASGRRGGDRQVADVVFDSHATMIGCWACCFSKGLPAYRRDDLVSV